MNPMLIDYIINVHSQVIKIIFEIFTLVQMMMQNYELINISTYVINLYVKHIFLWMCFE